MCICPSEVQPRGFVRLPGLCRRLCSFQNIVPIPAPALPTSVGAPLPGDLQLGTMMWSSGRCSQQGLRLSML